MLRVCVINPYATTIEEFIQIKEINDTLQEYYDLINCTGIDITLRYINNHPLEVVVDDLGLLKDDFKISAMCPSLYPSSPILAGVLILAGIPNLHAGELSSLTNTEISLIHQSIRAQKDGYFLLFD